MRARVGVGVRGRRPPRASLDASLARGLRTRSAWIPRPICVHSDRCSPGDVRRGREHTRPRPPAPPAANSSALPSAGPPPAGFLAGREVSAPPDASGWPRARDPGPRPRGAPAPGPAARVPEPRSPLALRPSTLAPALSPAPGPGSQPAPLPGPRSPVPACHPCRAPGSPLPGASRSRGGPSRPPPAARRPRASWPSPISGAGAEGQGRPARKGGYSGPGRPEQLRPPGFPAGCAAGTEGTLGQGSPPSPHRPTFLPGRAQCPPLSSQTRVLP